MQAIAVISQKGSSDPKCAGQPTGRAAGLETDSADLLKPCDLQNLTGPLEKRSGDIFTLFGADTGPALKDIPTVAAVDVCSRAWGRQAAQLFRTDRYADAAPEKC